MKVGDLVKFKDSWKESLRVQEARLRAQGFRRTKPDVFDADKLAIVVQDWDTHDNFAVIFCGETKILDFNDEAMEKVG